MNYLEHKVSLFKTANTRQDIAETLGYSHNFFELYIYSKDINLYYTEFNIDKKSKKERKIAAPNEQLKQIQKNLADILLAVFIPKECVHAFVKNKNIVSNARPHLKARHVLRLDLKDFFPSIHFGRVRNLFEAKPFNFPRQISSLLAKICCYKGSLPQGAPTSPIISNMICLRMDAQLTSLARHSNCIYTRYADDMAFSTNDKIFNKRILFLTNPLTLSSDIIKIIENYNYFKINNEKTNLRSCGDSKFITGVKVNLKLNVSRTKYREIRAMLNALRKYGHDKSIEEHIKKYSHRKRSVPQKDFYDIIQGKIAFLAMVRGNDDLIVLKLKNQLKQLYWYFNNIKEIDEDLIKYIEECGYYVTKEIGIHYIFLNIYRNNKKVGSIRKHKSNDKIETNVQQFSNKFIRFKIYPNNYYTFRNLKPGDLLKKWHRNSIDIGEGNYADGEFNWLGFRIEK